MKLCKTIWNYAVLKYLAIAICIVGLHAASAQRAEATQVFGSNYYEFVEASDPYSLDSNNTYIGNNSWENAKAAAAASVFNNINGHLATITSQAENDFLFGLVLAGNYSESIGFWLGGKAPEGWLVGPESGQTFIYTNWNTYEPNNAGYAYIRNNGLWYDDSVAQTVNGQYVLTTWGQGVPDLAHDPVIGYFVEYEGAAPIPEPATLLLFGTGIAWLAGTRINRKKKKAW